MVVVLSAFGCSEASKNSNGKVSPTPTPTPTEEETAAKAKKTSEEKLKATVEFVAKTESGWTLSGISGGNGEAECLVDVPCHLHLTQKDKNKVVVVVLRQFQRTDGSTYWLVYPASSIDLLATKIEEIKDVEREETLSELTIEDCQPIMDEWAGAAETVEDDWGAYRRY